MPRSRSRLFLRSLTLNVLLCASASVLATSAAGAFPEAPNHAQRGQFDAVAHEGLGGLILPGSEPPVVRAHAAACLDCRWRFTEPCAFEPDQRSTRCRIGPAECREDRLLRLWHAQGGNPWRELGLICVPVSGPLYVADVWSGMSSSLTSALPALTPRCYPQHGAVSDRPVRCVSGQAAMTRSESVTLRGVRVTVTLTPEWTWEWGEEIEAEGSRPIGQGPALALRFASPGTKIVTIQTRWRPSLIVDGLQAHPVTGFLRQRSSVRLEMGRLGAEVRSRSA